MSIHNAFKHADVGSVAGALVQAGVSIVPVTGKRPAMSAWRVYQKRRPSQSEVAFWYSQPGRGIAVVGGAVSNNLVIVDLDGAEAVAKFREHWPMLLNTLTITSGSGTGQHLYYRTIQPMKTVRSKGVELRSEGTYTVAPPSLHPSGQRYRVLHSIPVMVLDNLNSLGRWIQQRHRQPVVTPSAPLPTPFVGGSNPGWVKAAVSRELANLRAAQPGNANNTLNAVSYRLARICANPHSGLNPRDVQTDILEAARSLSHRDGLRATVATMESGWNAGYERPVTIPEPRNRRR